MKKNLLIVTLILLLLSGRFTIGRIMNFLPNIEIRFIFLLLFLLIFIILIQDKLTIYKADIYSITFIFLTIVFFILLIVSVLYSPNKIVAIIKLKDIAILALETIFIFITLRLFSDIDGLLKIIAITFVILGLIYLFPILYSVLSGAGRGTVYIGGPNVVTRILFFSLINSLYLNNIQNKSKYFILSLLFLIGIILVGSRGGIVGAAFSLTVLFLVKFRDRLKIKRIFTKKSLFLTANALIIMILMFKYIYRTFYERIVNLLFNNLYFSGRDIIYKETVEKISESPLFGYGLNGYTAVIGGRFNYPHNIILEVLLDVGFLGLILFSILLVFSIISIYKLRYYAEMYISILPIYVLVVSMLSGDMYDFRYYYFWVLVSFLPLTGITFNNYNKQKLI